MTLLSPRNMLPQKGRAAPAPPPIPLAGSQSAQFLEDVDADVRRLTMEIDRVLSGRGAAPMTARAQSLRQALASHGPVPEYDAENWKGAGDPFAWQMPAQPGGAVGAEKAAGWLGRAKRERRFKRVRVAASWVVALALAVMIIGACAFVLHGGFFDSAAIARVLQAVGL